MFSLLLLLWFPVTTPALFSPGIRNTPFFLPSVLLYFVFKTGFSVYPGSPGTHSVNKADLKRRDLPASMSQAFMPIHRKTHFKGLFSLCGLPEKPQQLEMPKGTENACPHTVYSPSNLSNLITHFIVNILSPLQVACCCKTKNTTTQPNVESASWKTGNLIPNTREAPPPRHPFHKQLFEAAATLEACPYQHIMKPQTSPSQLS